ncbi:hypothetical protein ACN47E_005020 [Coniothyrium glycines]
MYWRSQRSSPSTLSFSSSEDDWCMESEVEIEISSVSMPTLYVNAATQTEKSEIDWLMMVQRAGTKYSHLPHERSQLEHRATESDIPNFWLETILGFVWFIFKSIACGMFNLLKPILKPIFTYFLILGAILIVAEAAARSSSNRNSQFQTQHSTAMPTATITTWIHHYDTIKQYQAERTVTVTITTTVTSRRPELTFKADPK